MRIFGLVGHPLSHSFSQAYFSEKFREEGITDAEYRNFDMASIEELASVLKTPGLVGFNVTIPYKEAILPFLDELGETAKAVGAVNTIKIRSANIETRNSNLVLRASDLSLVGYNTDVIGFKQSIKPFLKPQHQRALVLGTGGASKAVIHVLNGLGIDHLTVSRNPTGAQLSYQDVNEHVIQLHPFIINTTPVGMHPNVDEAPPLPYEFLTDQHFLYDLVYNPKETQFMQEGTRRGAFVQNGMDMLKLQAEAAWNIWNS